MAIFGGIPPFFNTAKFYIPIVSHYLWGLRLTAGRRQKQTRQAEAGLNSTPAAYILGEVAPTSA